MGAMLTAQTAAKKTAAATRRIERARRAEAKKAANAERKQIAWEIKTQVPKYMRNILKEINEAINQGENRAEWGVNYTVRDEAAEVVKKRLAKRGFRCDVDFRHGTTDMGDFNAPCITEWSSTDFIVSWSKK